MVAVYSTSLADDGDVFLASVAEKYIESDETYEKYSDVSKAYFKRMYFFQVYKNSVLLLTLQNFFGDIANSEFLRKFELLITEHAKKTAMEKMLQIPRLSQKLSFDLYVHGRLMIVSDLVQRLQVRQTLVHHMDT